ncbi:uncharacterized protein LOC111782088 isoform X2 [Cucurbita pepo subsp. pepo]|uniref:uncharacterized protein LOC111782088 isoform X2 n=1 Tax=Cucurbita pepo subsp. pepo TaxID=3664 RepID=UPI000C9D8C44|nr:uncharacterized protein LOC111782088 isoform X2 [Cucurbita pepo subsp. pepo]
MSTGTARRVSRQDIQLVRSLIERCLQLDMNRKEVVETLLNHEKIDPSFTEHVPQSCYAPEHTGPALKQDDIDNPVGVSLGNAYSNGTQPVHSSMHTAVDMSSHARNDAAPQSSNMGLFQGMNGGMIKVETGYSNSSPYMFGTEGNVLDARQSIGNASVASFASVDSNTPSFNESLLDPDPSSFGFINQITRNFSLSDLTADFSQGSDILESYGRCPFLPTEADNILDTCENGDRLDGKGLDSVSKSLSYEEFRHN